MRFVSLTLVMLSCGCATASAQAPEAKRFAVQSGGKTYYTGAVKPKDWDKGVTFVQPVVRTAALPERFDWEELGVKTPVRDQGQCGSCWAFASTQTLEQSVKRLDGKDLDLAEQQIVSCASEFYGCQGGWFAGDYIAKNGMADESQFPYKAANVACKSGLTPVAKPVKWGYVGASGSTPTTEQIKAALMEYGPLSVTIAVSGSFSVDGNGVLQGCGNGTVNHMVAVVGYSDLIGSKGAWKMKNSWGTSWGNAGYAWVPYGCYKIGQEAAWSLLREGPGPSPNPPIVNLPVDVMVRYNLPITLAVKPESGVTYAWFVDDQKVGEGPTFTIKPTKSVQIKIEGTNNAGKSSSLTQLTVLL